MGKVLVKIKLTNYSDLVLRRLKLAKTKPRTVEVEALVDTGATRLYLKPSVIKRLGLARTATVRSQTTNGDGLPHQDGPVHPRSNGRQRQSHCHQIPFCPHSVRLARLIPIPDEPPRRA